MAKEKITPSMFRLVPSKPYFLCAVRPANRLDFSWNKEGSVYGTRSPSAIAEPKQALFPPVAISI